LWKSIFLRSCKKQRIKESTTTTEEERSSLTVGGHRIDIRWEGGNQQSFLFNIHLSSGLWQTLRFDVPRPEHAVNSLPSARKRKIRDEEESRDEGERKQLKLMEEGMKGDEREE